MIIKKLIFLCLFFYLGGIPFEVNGQQNVGNQDGVDWTANMTEPVRFGYLVGFLAHAWVMQKQLSVYMDDDSKILSVFNEPIARQLKNDINDIKTTEITVVQFVDGVDAFYKDFSNRRIKIVDAIYIVKMQITGESPEVIEAQIRYLKFHPLDINVVINIHNKREDFFRKKGHHPTYIEIKEGEFNYEDLLRIGQIVTSDNKIHFLFHYGQYK